MGAGCGAGGMGIFPPPGILESQNRRNIDYEILIIKIISI
jgi:hypothetical protein